MKKIFIYLFLLITLLSSCKKYLDIKPDSSLVVPSAVPDLQAILDDPEFMNYNTPLLGEASSDDYFLSLDTYNSLFAEEQKKYTWTPHDYNFPNDWALAYQAIYPANLCLEQIEKTPRTNSNAEAWDNVKGSALFLRSYYFLQLSGLFAKAYDEASFNNDWGIALRTTSDFSIPSVRSSVKQTYDKIIEDAKAASLYLPGKPLHSLRPSKAAAFALVARTYLWMRQYDSAGKYARLCLDIKKDLLDYNDPSAVNLSSTSPFRRFNPETIFYSTMNNYLSLPLPLSGALVDTLLYAAYDNDDLRKPAFFRLLGGYPSFKGSYSRNLFFLFSGIASDEVYLTSAESYARTGQVSLALQELNTLLIKRWKTGTFVPVTAATAQEALVIILKERRKELVMRGLRWMDIKRRNKEGADIRLRRYIGTEIFTLDPNDRRYALPIPADVIRETNMQQN